MTDSLCSSHLSTCSFIIAILSVILTILTILSCVYWKFLSAPAQDDDAADDNDIKESKFRISNQRDHLMMQLEER